MNIDWDLVGIIVAAAGIGVVVLVVAGVVVVGIGVVVLVVVGGVAVAAGAADYFQSKKEHTK